MKVLIVGAGVGGLTAAAFLERCDFDYDIIDKAPDWSHIGYHIVLWDNGRNILRKLGCAEAYDACSEQIRGYSIRHGDGTLIKDLDFTHLGTRIGAPMTIAARDDLHRILRTRMQSNRIRMNTSVTRFEHVEGGLQAHFSDGTTAFYDLVIGADGVHSKTREQLFPHAIESFRNWRVWYAWIDTPYAEKNLVLEYMAPCEFAAVFTAHGKTTAWLFAPTDHAVWDTETGRVKRLKKLFAHTKRILPAIEALKDADAVPSDLSETKLSSWHTDRAVLIGDAAHCMGPYAGIGSTLALEDAYVLVGEMAQRGSSGIPGALRRYEEKRRPRVNRAHKVSTFARFTTFNRTAFMAWLIEHTVAHLPNRFITHDMRRLLTEEI